ncbi:hypothetical protein SUDANB66_03245 [Streptomyces sp. SudanB66_2053]
MVVRSCPEARKITELATTRRDFSNRSPEMRREYAPSGSTGVGFLVVRVIRRPSEVPSLTGSGSSFGSPQGLAQQHDLPADGSPVSPHAVARRALLEELAVHDGDGTEIELLGLGLDVVNHQWAVFCRAVVPGLDEAALRLRWTRGVTDKWEHDRFEFVDADPESVLGFIADEPESRWTPCAPALFYLALVRGAVRRAGGDPAARFLVEQAEQKVMRERGL